MLHCTDEALKQMHAVLPANFHFEYSLISKGGGELERQISMSDQSVTRNAHVQYICSNTIVLIVDR